MTANAVTDDLKKIRPTPQQVATYTRRENELRQRYLKGILYFDAVLDGLQKLMEMTRSWINLNAQPEIPDWAHKANPIVQHIPCGMVEPARIATASVFQEGEDVLEDEEYIARAQRLPGAMNACALDFYAKPENWKYLPKDADVIVFPNTVFLDSDGHRYVRYLCRNGARWNRSYSWLDSRLYRHALVAVLASSS